jgi:hypothetical protein
MKKQYIYIIIILGFLFYLQSVWACSCFPPSELHSLQNNDAAFIGRVTNIEFMEDPGKVVEPRVKVHFDVLRNWKGIQGSDVIVETKNNQGTCQGYRFELGHEYLVFGDLTKSQVGVEHLCGGTRELRHVTELTLDRTDPIVFDNPLGILPPQVVPIVQKEKKIVLWPFIFALIMLIIALTVFKKYKKE